MKRKVKVNDVVTITTEKEDSPDRRARVLEVFKDGVYVSNLNMPFCGTFSKKYIPNRHWKLT
jgi:hypothetical protein